MKHIFIIISILVFCTAESKEYTEYDKKSVLFYIQSISSPRIFKVCNKLYPELSDAFEIGLKKWNETNERLVEYGKKLSKEDVGLKGIEFENHMKKLINSMFKELKKQSEQDLKEGCGEALVYLITES